MVTRGPGATNGCHGVHIARQDSTPMILFIGQVAREMRWREAFQEIDYRQMFGASPNGCAEIDDPARIPESSRAPSTPRRSGRPGPVVVALPEDMLSEPAACADAARYQPVQAHPALQDMARLHVLLAAAKRPFMILGGGGWDARACADIQSVRGELRSAGRRVVPPPGLLRQHATPATPAMSASRSRRRSATASATPISCSSSGRVWARPRAAATA